MTDKELDLDTVLNKWELEHGQIRDQRQGVVPVRRLENLLNVIGYESILGESEILHFLADNPGAINAIIQWMLQNPQEDWKQAIDSDVPFEETIESLKEDE